MNLGSKPPAVVQQPKMPALSDEEIQAARRRQLAKMAASSGRMSTVLTNTSDKLG